MPDEIGKDIADAAMDAEMSMNDARDEGDGLPEFGDMATTMDIEEDIEDFPEY